MPESRLRGSVRGAVSNGRPYREMVIAGVKFTDGVAVTATPDHRAA